MERVGTGRVRHAAHAEAAGRSPLLREAARSLLPAVCQPAQPRSACARAADLDARQLRRRPRAGDGPVLHAGDAGGHQGAQDRRAHGRRVPRAGAHRRRREHQAVRPRARPVRSRPAVLLLRRRGPGLAHDVARARSGAPGL